MVWRILGERLEQISRNEEEKTKRRKKDRGDRESVYCWISWQNKTYLENKESVRRGRESVRNYWVQLAELFQLVGLPSSFSGTRERERVWQLKRWRRGKKWRKRQEESDKLKGGESEGGGEIRCKGKSDEERARMKDCKAGKEREEEGRDERQTRGMWGENESTQPRKKERQCTLQLPEVSLVS